MNILEKKEAETTFKKIFSKIKKEKKKEKISKNIYFYYQLEETINKIIKNKFKIDYKTELILPPNHLNDYDLTFNVFKISSILNKNPEEIAKTIKEELEKLNFDFFEKIDFINGFINIKLNFLKLFSLILQEVNNLKEKYGKNDYFKNKICVIDYSSPNIAKPIGVGHLRSTIIGEALAKIYENNGGIVIRLNHLGDWGTQFGQLITAYLKWGDDKKIKQNPLAELKNLYVRFQKEKEINKSLELEAKNNFNLLEKGNKKFLKIWQYFRKLSIKEFKKTYQKFKIKFDSYIGEAYYFQKTKSLLNECLKKNIAFKENDNSIVVKLENLPSFILQKSDGSTVYILRDLAALKDRILKFKPQKILYVVGQEQELHFQQLFELAKLLNLNKKTELQHISFGLVLKEGKKMSTRANRFISLDLLIEKILKKSQKILKQKNPNLKEKEIEKISQLIGIGAIIYNDLKQSREKNIDFDWEKMLNFKEGTSIYLQYTVVRINSILKNLKKKKIKIDKIEKINIQKISQVEQKILNQIIFFPKTIIKAYKNHHPHLIAEYLEDLAKLFNNFYSQFSIIKTQEKDLLIFRIYLIKATKQIIKNGLKLLNIEVPEKM